MATKAFLTYDKGDIIDIKDAPVHELWAGCPPPVIDIPDGSEADIAAIYGEARLRHENTPDANTFFAEGRIVALKRIEVGDDLSLDTALLHYELPKPFTYKGELIRGFGYLDREDQESKMIFTEPSVRAEAVSKGGYKVRSVTESVVVRGNGDMGQATWANRDIKMGEEVFNIGGFLLPFPTTYTVSLTMDKHLLFLGGAECLAHSCDPNVMIKVSDGDRLVVEALRDIAEGEMIAFNYLTTEWTMSGPFQCLCGCDNCYGYINGLKNQPLDKQQELLPLATPFVREQHNKQLAESEKE